VPLKNATEGDFIDYGIESLSSVPVSAWNELSDNVEILQYRQESPEEQESVSFNIDPVHPIYLLGDQPKLLQYTDDTNKEESAMTIQAIPKGQLVFPEGDIDVSGGAEGLTISASNVKIIASPDKGVSWYAHIEPVWKYMNPTKKSVKEYGMTPDAVNNLTKKQIDSFLNGSTTLRFAYYLEQEDLTDEVHVDQVKIVTSSLATETPTLESIKIGYDELTIEGRMKDLEETNAINLAMLNFKANALMFSEKYNLHDLAIDTFEDESGVESATSIYNQSDKSFTGKGEVLLSPEFIDVSPSTLWVNAEGSSDLEIEYSTDTGTTWSTIVEESLHELNDPKVDELQVKVKLPSGSSKLSAISYGWA